MDRPGAPPGTGRRRRPRAPRGGPAGIGRELPLEPAAVTASGAKKKARHCCRALPVILSFGDLDFFRRSRGVTVLSWE
jgi:hypothetical protein